MQCKLIPTRLLRRPRPIKTFPVLRESRRKTAEWWFLRIIDSLTNALASAQEAQTRLTESLAAEQALHAGTIQKQLTMQDEKPKGFFGRLFGKKKKENEP